MINHTIVCEPENETPLIDDHSMLIFTYIIYTVVCPGVNIFGIVSNLINIMCFVKQGFKEPINISFMGLAISDIGCLFTSCLINVMFTPAMAEADLPFDVREVSFPVASMPHVIFTRITSWITAIITIERCLCVLVPLKVKHMITPERMLTTVASVYIILIASGAPIYIVKNLGMKFSPTKNRTLLGLVTSTDGEYFSMIYFALNSFVVPFLAFILICICTAILVYNLHQQTKWRAVSTNVSTAGITTRSHKAAKMVVIISSLYISCTIPITITLLTLAFVPDINIGGKHLNVGLVCAGIGILAESINSSANIYIYYHMSSKYKVAFLQLFSKVDIRIKSVDSV